MVDTGPDPSCVKVTSKGLLIWLYFKCSIPLLLFVMLRYEASVSASPLAPLPAYRRQAHGEGDRAVVY